MWAFEIVVIARILTKEIVYSYKLDENDRFIKFKKKSCYSNRQKAICQLLIFTCLIISETEHFLFAYLFVFNFQWFTISIITHFWLKKSGSLFQNTFFHYLIYFLRSIYWALLHFLKFIFGSSGSSLLCMGFV